MSVFTVLPMLPRVSREADTLVFNNVPSYAEIASVAAGAAAYTSFTAPIYSNDGLKLAKTAIVRILAQGPCRLRPISFYTDRDGVRQYNRSYAEVTPNGNPGNMGSVITDMFNATWSDAVLRAFTHSYTLEVYGSGKIYEAQLEIDYIV